MKNKLGAVGDSFLERKKREAGQNNRKFEDNIGQYLTKICYYFGRFYSFCSRGMRRQQALGLSLFMTLCTGPLWAGIYIGTDATPPQTYQSSANYPSNIVVSGNTAAERNCRLYYDGKGPIPPLTCSGSTPMTASQSSAPGMSTVASTMPVPKSPAPGMAKVAPVVVPTKNDQAAQQAPLASTTIPPLTRPLPAKKPVEPPKPMFITVAEPGSLKANVERIVAQSHWGTVVWTLPVDYNWKGTMTIKADNVQGALSQLLKEYPVRAIFYDKNRIVAIESRRVI